MQLLLFLSALLTGLTGVIAGDRTVERSQIERLGDVVAEQVRGTAQPAVVRQHAAYCPTLAMVSRSVPRILSNEPIGHALHALGIDTRRLE